MSQTHRNHGEGDATRQESLKGIIAEAARNPEVAAALEAMDRLSRSAIFVDAEVRTVYYATGGND
jgi:hypothetical protein